MRHMLGFLTFLVLLGISYLLAGAIQVCAVYYFGGGANVPRMGYEKMPFFLLLSPVMPAFAVDNLLNKITLARVGFLLLFLVPFMALATASFRLVYRAPRHSGVKV